MIHTSVKYKECITVKAASHQLVKVKWDVENDPKTPTKAAPQELSASCYSLKFLVLLDDTCASFLYHFSSLFGICALKNLTELSDLSQASLALTWHQTFTQNGLFEHPVAVCLGMTIAWMIKKWRNTLYLTGLLIILGVTIKSDF